MAPPWNVDGRGSPYSTLSAEIGEEEHRRRARQSSSLDNLISDGVPYEFAYGMQFEFAHDIGAMSFGSLNADAESHGNFLAALALRE
jgi:hypothetical protein